MHVKPVLCALVALAALGFSSQAETRVGGVINGTARWTPEGSPYVVESDIVVARTAELIVYPGTRVVVNEGKGLDRSVKQVDKLDSTYISIKIEGSLTCIGRKTTRITFMGAAAKPGNLGWYGIVFNHSRGSSCEMAHTDVTGACNGVTAAGCSPLIRNCVFEQNNVGVTCISSAGALVYNCIITGNFSAGVRVNNAAPHIANSIIMSNKNNGVWCEASPGITLEYNCLHNNGDGDYLDCDPRLGRFVAKLKSRDSVDYAGNLYCDPMFFGSLADSVAFARDINRPTDKSVIKQVQLALIVEDTLRDSSYAQYKARIYPRFTLSKYSPCVNTGNPAKAFKDVNGSRSDRGLFGGPKKFARSVQ